MTSFLPRLVGIGSVKFIRSFRRAYSFDGSSYDGPGKTTVTVLNSDADYGLMIDRITTSGFRLNNGLWVLGPMIMFPRSVIGWNIASSADINEDSLALFEVLEPTLDILIVGLDNKYEHNQTPFIEVLKKFAKQRQISLEILPVLQACTTYNFLNAEHRYAAAALLPPKEQLPENRQAIADAALKRRKLHKPDKPEQITSN